MAIDISFDKIAAVYDAQRAHPPEVAAAVGRAVALAAGGPLLEIGVGTGRIAIPAAAAGARVTGVDVSAEMLEAARARAAGAGLPLALLRADAQHLPFADNSFAAALAVHVLHLLPDWRAGLAEVARALRPGGVLLQGQDWRAPESCVGLLRGRLRSLVIELLPGARPPGAGAAVPQALARLGGATGEPTVAARWTRAVSPAEVLAGMAARVDAETWALPEDVLGVAITRLHAWAELQWGDLDLPQEVEHRFLLTETRF